MLTVKRKCSRICGADAQLGDLHSMPTHKIHGIVLKFPAEARASHFLDQVKEVYVSTAWFLEDLYLHLSNDLVTMPGMNVSIWELGNAQSKPRDIMHAVGSGFLEKTILPEAA
jgi:hypothetical protein